MDERPLSGGDRRVVPRQLGIQLARQVRGGELMTAEKTAKRSGIFNRAIVGTELQPVTIEIERERIRFFSQTLGIVDPVHFDVEAAISAGFPDLLAPPSFMMVMEALAEDERKRQSRESWYEALACDFRYLLHGSEAYQYHGSVFAGDRLSFITAFGQCADKKGGLLELADVHLRVVHEDRGLIVSGSRTLLHRLD